MTRTDPYYRRDLALVHHLGFGFHADACAPGIVSLLEPVRERGGLVVELGCGSGLLTRYLVDAGHRVIATDASPSMLELARGYVPDAHEIRQVLLPDDPIPEADAIVSVGHVLNYLPDASAIDRAFVAIAGALRPGGLLAIDLSLRRSRAASDARHPGRSRFAGTSPLPSHQPARRRGRPRPLRAARRRGRERGRDARQDDRRDDRGGARPPDRRQPEGPRLPGPGGARPAARSARARSSSSPPTRASSLSAAPRSTWPPRAPPSSSRGRSRSTGRPRASASTRSARASSTRRCCAASPCAARCGGGAPAARRRAAARPAGTPAECADVALFLASPASSFVTGRRAAGRRRRSPHSDRRSPRDSTMPCRATAPEYLCIAQQSPCERPMQRRLNATLDGGGHRRRRAGRFTTRPAATIRREGSSRGRVRLRDRVHPGRDGRRLLPHDLARRRGGGQGSASRSSSRRRPSTSPPRRSRSSTPRSPSNPTRSSSPPPTPRRCRRRSSRRPAAASRSSPSTPRPRTRASR